MSSLAGGTIPGSGSEGPIVSVSDVFVAFPGAAGAVMALRGAELSVGAGERLLVQGPNGSGKSTLLRVITGEQPVVSGTVRVGGAALHELTAAARRRWRARNMGFIDQHARRGLLAEVDVLDNVALQLRLTGLSGKDARPQAERILADFGLSGLGAASIAELSAGEAQKVAICAAVAHGPRLVLADEPTGELEEQSAREVYEMLTRIAGDGTSIILVSHDPRASEFADRAVRIRDGRVAEQWTPGSPEVQQVPDSRGWVRLPRPPELPDVTAKRTAPTSAPLTERGETMVELVGVTADYPGRTVFADLDLRVRGGELVAVAGGSGSGKSTLVMLVCGLLDPSSGTVRVGQTAWSGLGRADRAALRSRWLAFGPQRPSLVEALTVRENLELTMAARLASDLGGEIEQTTDRLGLSALLNQPVDRLSGGERQRVSVARCLVSGAPVLVLDEPTSQQDEVSAARIVAALDQEASSGRAVLVATHDRTLAAQAKRTVHLGPSTGATRS